MLRGRRTRIENVLGKAAQLGQRDEAEASGLELGDQLPERGHRLAAIAAAVVEHDDPARAATGAGVFDDPLYALSPPVLGVEVRESEYVAAPDEACELPLVRRGDG